MSSLPVSLISLSGRAVGELAALANSGATSLTLKTGHGAKFPASDFNVRIDAESIHCSSRTGDVLTVTATTAAHLSNAVGYESLASESPLLQWLYDNLLGHTHAKSEIADFDHTHAESEVANLVSDLAAKEAAANKGVVNGYASLDGGGKVPAAQLPASGSDPWTYVRLASDFPTSSSSAVDVTGMSLTPAANLRYEIEGLLLIRTNTTTVGPRPGIAWPTGMTDGVGKIDTTSSATARLLTNGNINAAMLAAVGGLPNTTQSWPAKIHVTMFAGATPGSTFRIQLASETAGTTVTMKANSWFRWRTF